MSRPEAVRIAEEIGESCLNSRARVLSRVVTSIYDDELRDVGIKASQLNLLVAIATAGSVRRTDVGRYLHLDSSTLTRNLRVMETNGWIEEAADDSDGRGRPVRITAIGERVLTNAAPAWRIAQRRTSKLLGIEGRSSLVRLVDGISD